MLLSISIDLFENYDLLIQESIKLPAQHRLYILFIL